MALKTVDQYPKISDTIRFFIETPDVNGCLSADPYKVDSLKIYYVERDFLSTNHGEYNFVKSDAALEEKLKNAREQLCQDPSNQNISLVQRLQNELTSKAQSVTYYYKDAVVMEEVGSSLEPAWLSTDVENAYIGKNYIDNQNKEVTLGNGSFYYDWTPKGKVREGDFFLCWTWTLLPAGDSMSAHIPFTLMGDGKAVQTLPTHATPKDKYNILLERYLPEMYKSTLTSDDITPEVTDKLNNALADGFTFIEDYANQLIDLFDANVLHESMLVYLSNLFSLKLKSEDPTLWRRQIKEAVPLFKKKGTLEGLKEAFAQSGMTLENYEPLWQVVSPYTWQQSFLVKDSPTFKLDKKPLDTIDNVNFGIWIRRAGTQPYVELTNDVVEFSEVDCEYFITWVGDEKSIDGLELYSGDILKILYQHRPINDADTQNIENYIRNLPLADTRDEFTFVYPPKNWNVRVIEANDPMFDLIVPVRHPFHEDIVFGHVRTEFPFSENIYNMEEYSGSTRETNDVCLIDRDFRDPCGSCMGSKYNVSIAIEALSDNRIVEVYDILREYTPFNTQLHNINFTGTVSDFVYSPVEQIDFIVQYNYVQNIISGSANPFFNRVMEDGLTSWVVDRDSLAEQIIQNTGKIGTAHNLNVGLVAPNVDFGSLGLIIDNHIMEILSPSPNAGIYALENVQGQTALVASGVIEPLNTNSFTFRLSNIIYDYFNGSIVQEYFNILKDDSAKFSTMSIRTLWDVGQYGYPSSWRIYFPSLSKTVDVSKIINGELYFDSDTAITAGNIAYVLIDHNGNPVVSSTGNLVSKTRGRVSSADFNITKLSDLIHAGDFFLYDDVEYVVDTLQDDDGSVYVRDYSDGDAQNVPIRFLRRLVAQETGFFDYSGLRLIAPVDHEAEFNIQNGSGSPTPINERVENSTFKENFLIQIGSFYYKIAGINGRVIDLEGYPQDWGTLLAGGTSVQYSILQFINNTVDTKFLVFDQLNRSGKDPVVREIYSTVTNDVAIVALSMPENPDGHGINEIMGQQEEISFQIEYKDGTIEQGKI